MPVPVIVIEVCCSEDGLNLVSNYSSAACIKFGNHVDVIITLKMQQKIDTAFDCTEETLDIRNIRL